MNDILAWILAAFAALWPGGDDAAGRQYGYVVADYAYIAPAHGGTLAAIPVAEGDRVKAGDILFRLDDQKEKAALEAATAKAEAARNTLADKRAGSRPEEIAVIEDTLARAEADLELARSNFERSSRLRDQGVVSGAQFDKDRSALRMAEARVSEIKAQLTVARLPARPEIIAAAEKETRAAEAEVTRNQALLDETVVRAPADGYIDRTFFVPGEQASPSTPVVSLLPDGKLKARFFIPETSRARYALGARVLIDCDGCAAPVPATVVRLATEAEFTPPVIFSLDERSRLVFMAEARPDGPAPGLLPGQPVDVRLAP